jgi:hypothetical protein
MVPDDRNTLRSKEEASKSSRVAIIHARTERLKLWGSIVGIIAAIVTSSLAYFKPEEDEGARDVYKELSTAVSKISENQVELHKDVAAIQGYLRGRYAAEKKVVDEIKQEKEEREESKSSRIRIGVASGVARRTATKPAPTSVVLMPPEKLFRQETAPPDTQAQKPGVYKPPPVDSVVKK